MMKTAESVKATLVAITILILVGTIFGKTIIALSSKNEYVSINKTALKDSKLNIKPATAELNKNTNSLAIKTENTETIKTVSVAEAQTEQEQKQEEAEAKKNEIVYEGMTLGELSDKLDRTLHSTISGQGYTFASYAVELGVDPYLAVAIVMHETGCAGECSTLLKECNNVGGMKGGSDTKCNGGSYASFSSLEEGIRAYMQNLYRNYTSQGLTTADAMASKYAASQTWASQVNAYINSIKAK